MTSDETTKLRELANAATPGPWSKDIFDVCAWDVERVVAKTDGEFSPPAFNECQSNAAFIAAADPQAVIALLDEVDALKAKLVQVTAALSDEMSAVMERDVLKVKLVAMTNAATSTESAWARYKHSLGWPDVESTVRARHYVDMAFDDLHKAVSP